MTTSTGQRSLPTTRSAAPGRRASLAVVVVDSLLDQIVSGALAEGTVLPTETELCDSFNVSRTVVREAMKVLQDKGLVRVRQGHGTSVAEPDAWRLTDAAVLGAAVRGDPGLDLLDELVRIRELLECSMAEAAAVHISPEQLAEMAELLDDMDRALSQPNDFAVADIGFHDVIMVASRNRLSRAIVRTVTEEARTSSRYMGRTGKAHREHSNAQHRAIYEAIAAGDGAAAAAAMSSHITWSWQERRPRRARAGER